MVKRRAIVFVVSDFIGEHDQKILQITNKKHDCISIVYHDPREKKIPPLGLIELEDSENRGAYNCQYERPGVQGAL